MSLNSNLAKLSLKKLLTMSENVDGIIYSHVRNFITHLTIILGGIQVFISLKINLALQK